ncbi:tripartite motif-containing protein 16-like [Engraulis encrasicolus]|uniref:tripartite motif-containing protein 16-like n=1 Tax=Engraulis encrasicolus TaxID=184585 RepID=UPI002FCE7FF7
MAEAMAGNKDIFECPICVDFLNDPVTLTCGHSYCLRCIEDCWNEEDVKGVYSCPQCRKTFTQRPVLNKNIIIAELVDQMKKSRIQTAAPVECAAGPGDVACDVCTQRKLKAVKSCLECLMSYCGTHLKAHDELTGRNHTMFDATGQLQERICPLHKKVFEIFCRTDQSCICYLCTMEDHRGHDTITAKAEWSHKKEGLGQSQKRCQQTIQLKEKELQELRKAVETLKSGAQTAVEESERMFTEMIRSIERRRSEVTELIRAQEKAEVSRAEGLLKRLEQEIAELKRTDAEMKQLSQTQDSIHFLKNIVSITGRPYSTISTSVTISQNFSLEPMKESVSALKMQLEEKLESVFKQEIVKISAAAITHVQIIQSIQYPDPELPVRRADSKDLMPPDSKSLLRTSNSLHSLQTFTFPSILRSAAMPATREDFLKYCCHFTLDPNTANRELHLSEGNRRVEWTDEHQSYPEHPDRFDDFQHVLCKEGVSARCYWEVEWSGHSVGIAVSYKSISRKGRGDECVFGYNDQSWSLYLGSTNSNFWHNNKKTKLPLVASSRIGVYVDHRAGTLAFYSISGDTMTLLHRVHTTFTHTLYPGFLVWGGGSVKLL